MSASRFSPYQFVTLRTFERAPRLARDDLKKTLLGCIGDTKKRFRLTIAAYVVLDDHVHLLFGLPAEHESSAVMNDMRAGFMRAWRKPQPLLERDMPNDTPFWAHGIEYRAVFSSDELRAHLDFIHYDPVRHGLVTRAADYRWSSLPARIAQGHYPDNWAEIGPPASVARVARECEHEEKR